MKFNNLEDVELGEAESLIHAYFFGGTEATPSGPKMDWSTHRPPMFISEFQEEE